MPFSGHLLRNFIVNSILLGQRLPESLSLYSGIWTMLLQTRQANCKACTAWPSTVEDLEKSGQLAQHFEPFGFEHMRRCFTSIVLKCWCLNIFRCPGHLLVQILAIWCNVESFNVNCHLLCCYSS